MKVEIDGLRVDVDRDGDVVTIEVFALRGGDMRTLGISYLNDGEDSGVISISERELRGAGLAAER